MTADQPKGFESWAIVEVMGHQTYPGLVTEQVVAGAAFVRVDVPECPGEEDGLPTQPAFTKLIGPGSIYAITPVAEELARAAAARLRPKPINVYLPELRPPAATRRALSPGEDPHDDDDDDDDLYFT